MSLPQDLSFRTLDEIVDRLGATEVRADDGGPFLTLFNAPDPDPVGQMRVFTSALVPKVVYCGMAVPAFSMDTHMIFGFMPEDSAVPHFTLDSVNANGSLAFHLDLIPRAELATHVPYMDAVYGGLTQTYEDTSAWPGLTKARVGPRQYAMMSPWMLVNRADEAAFREIDGPVDAYVRHWLDLVEKGLPDDALASVASADLVGRDHALRDNLFNPEVDPVWGRIGHIIGEDTVTTMRAQLSRNALG